MNFERKLTKAHKFNFELKYMNHFIMKVVPSKEEGLTIEILDNIVALDIFYLLSYDRELIYQFIDDYKDVINWYKLLESSFFSIEKDIENFVDRYNEYFYHACWVVISKKISNFSNKELFLKYKDKLKWNCINLKRANFDLDTWVELKDYIDFNSILEFDDYDDNLVAQIKMYAIDHIDEVLTYRREDVEEND